MNPRSLAAWMCVTLLGAGPVWPQATVAPAPMGPSPAASAEPRTVTFAADVYFDKNKAELLPQAQHKLDILARQLQHLEVKAVTIIGHTDGDASDDFNQRLSVARSGAVEMYLAAQGIDDSRIHIGGRGKVQPVADNVTRAGKARNRRVEIEVIAMRR